MHVCVYTHTYAHAHTAPLTTQRPPTGVTRLGSPASPRMVPVNAAACRAYRDPSRTRNHLQVPVVRAVRLRAARATAA